MLCLNCADTHGTDNQEAAEAVADYPQLVYLNTPLNVVRLLPMLLGKVYQS